MELIEHFIDGKKYSGSSKKKSKVFNPATGEQTAEVKLASTEDTNKAIESSKKAFTKWSNTPPLQRARVMFKFKDLIEKNSDELTKIIVSEHGKVYDDAKGSLTRGLEVVEFAKKNQIDIALIDTAGRLQNKKNLMEEYKKIINVLKKIDPSYPNEVILVLDATTGQNAFNQVEEFSKIHNLTGLIITKLDSTAKGGVVLAICKKYDLPIIAVGMGEKETDLLPFSAEYFAKALLGVSS